MELCPLFLTSFPLVCTSLLLIVTVMMRIILWKRSSSTNYSNLPPGPPRLPLIGNLHQLLIGYLPHQRLGELAKKYGPDLMHLQLGELTAIVISSAEAAKQVMKTHDICFAQRPLSVLALKIIFYNGKDISTAPYGEYWRQMRKLCVLELLSVRRVQSFRSIREEEMSKLIRSIYRSSAGSLMINFCSVMQSLMYRIISRAAFGKVWKGEDAFYPALKKLEEAAGGFSVVDLYPSIKFLQVISGLRHKLERQHKEIDKILEDIVSEHKARRSKTNEAAGAVTEGIEDLVDVLLNVQEKGILNFPLSTENIKAIIMDMFIGGSETTSTTIEWVMSELVRNPRVMEKAQSEVRRVFHKGKGNVEEADNYKLDYLTSVIKETMRLHPPFPLLPPRECRDKCEINGYNIPIKSQVFINAWAIGRDPNCWSEPHKFIPERFINGLIDYTGTNNFEFIPFGAGRRNCPGISFAMASIQLALAQMLYHFDWKLPDGIKPENLDMTETFGVVAKRKNDLILVPIPYNHLISD